MKSKNKKKTKEKADQGTTAFHTFLVFLRYNALGRFLAFAFILVMVILINILLSGNELETFALITGIELVVLMILAWTVFLLKRNTKEETEEE